MRKSKNHGRNANNHLYKPNHKKMTPISRAIAVAEAEEEAVEIVAVIVKETNNTIIIMREETMKTINNRMRRIRDATIIRSITVISDNTTSLVSMRMRAQSAEGEVAGVAVVEAVATTTMKMVEVEEIEEAVVAIEVQAVKKARMREETMVAKMVEEAEVDAKTTMMTLMANINLREEVGASETRKVNSNSKSQWLQKLVAVLRLVKTLISPT